MVYTVQCCRPASKRIGCYPLPFTVAAAERSQADHIEERGYRAGWVYGRSAGRSTGWCFFIRARCVPWQGTFGRAPISKYSFVVFLWAGPWRGGENGACDSLGLDLGHCPERRGVSIKTRFSYAFPKEFPYRMNHILECEFYLLELMDCCLIVYHPYRPLLQYVQDMGQEDMLLPLAW
ncbi:Cyclin-C [Galemys pyrenaicus]|uniref:Cyclin-C n=1 Tax=Galemys pyrenaicus TaxID=202257 RepID=A0A8J6DU72_GALPY|nr:Cyclin-C [Galemys pyrenaicus]